MDRSKWAAPLASIFSFTLLAGTHSDVQSQTSPPPQPDINVYLLELNKSKGISTDPGHVTIEDKQRIDEQRAKYPNIQFVKLDHLKKYVSLPADSISFDEKSRDLTLTVINIEKYRSTLRDIYLNPFVSWPSHTVITFNGYTPNDEDICAFVPNKDLAEVQSVRFIKDSVGTDLKIDWDKAGQTPKSGTAEKDLATQQKIRFSNTSLPTHLFDAKNLTCVVIEMPDSTSMLRLSQAPDGQWVRIIKDGQLVRGDVPEPSADTAPQPKQ